MSFITLPNLINPFLNQKTTSSLWSIFVSRMRDCGFNSQIVFTFTYTPVRNKTGIKKDIPAVKPKNFLIVGNNLIYMADMPYDSEIYGTYLLKNNLIQSDPLAYHARENGTVAILGKDFLSPHMPNYEDAKKFWNQPEEFMLRNCLCVPLHQNSPWTPHGFGLHTTMNGEDIKKMVSINGERILLDCYQYAAEFNKLFRLEFAKECGITKRQHEVLKLLCQGLANNEIADLLEVTEASVSFHLKAVKEKLDITSNREIPLVAARMGFVDLG